MKNIGIIITKLNGGGAERCASNLSVELSKKFNVFLIVFDGRNITYPYGGKLINLDIADSNTTINRIKNVIKRVNAVRKIKKENQIDCTISLLDGPNLVNAFSKCGDKTIVSIRNRLSSERVGKLRRKLIIYSSMHSDLTVCLSKMVEKDMHDAFGIPKDQMTTIYNHCDPGLLHSLVADLDKPSFIEDDKVYFTTMGRLNKQKGQWHLLRAFKDVLESIPNARLIIMGEGELEQPLKQLAVDLQIDSYVIFTGYQKNPHAMLEYSEAFVFSSLFEGLGNVLLEALAFDMPIISTDCVAGPREILAPNSDLNHSASDIECEEYGILVPVMDEGHFDAVSELTPEEKCFSQAIIMLHNDKSMQEQYRKKATSRISYFNIENVLDEWIKCIF